ncbi:MAG: energy transducer TonB [Candidatus Aminicenantaceae bacterium]
MSYLSRIDRSFQTAFILSLSAHILLFITILVSPSLPTSSRKGMIHYVNLIALPGGGGGGGSGGSGGSGTEAVVEKKQTLRDLTTPQKVQEEPPSSIRHPVEKPKKEIKPKSEKKAIISQPKKQAEPSSKSKGFAEKAGSGSGRGTGLRIGVGEGPGFGSGYGSQIGLSSFPFTYYLQIIMDRVSTNWFTFLVDPGISGNFQTIVYFKIYKNGQISNVKIEESSGIESLNLSAIRAVHSSAPFPPLPREYDNEYLGIHLIFEHSK